MSDESREPHLSPEKVPIRAAGPLSTIPACASAKREDTAAGTAEKKAVHHVVGSAFEYLFRFELQRLAPRVFARQWVAEAAVETEIPKSGRIHPMARARSWKTSRSKL